MRRSILTATALVALLAGPALADNGYAPIPVTKLKLTNAEYDAQVAINVANLHAIELRAEANLKAGINPVANGVLEYLGPYDSCDGVTGTNGFLLPGYANACGAANGGSIGGASGGSSGN
jgi:hypothetical protein